MTTVNLLRGDLPHTDAAARMAINAHWRDDVPSLGSALSALLEEAQAGRVSTTAPGDRWLVLRIEEALRGFEDIQQIATGNEPPPSMYAGGTAGTALILARRAGTPG